MGQKNTTDVNNKHHRKMRLRGGIWNGVIVRQYAVRQRGHFFFDDELVMDSAHCYVMEQPAAAKKPGTMRLKRANG
jgi:hypothetical protein